MSKDGGIHLFLCQRGEVLPRWSEAFRHAAAVSHASLEDGPPAAKARMVWFRLRHDAPVADQLAILPPTLKDVPLVVLSDLPEDEEALAAFAAGARGYCNTHSTPAHLAQVARVVQQGGLWIGPTLMRRLLVATSSLPPVQLEAEPSDWAALLTGREREVAGLVAAGASNKEVARKLDITERTVKAHVGAVFSKLGVRDRLQLSLVVNGRLQPGRD